MITTHQTPALPRMMWAAVALALLAAMAYVLINVGVLTVGDVPREEGSMVIAYIAAGCYLLGGLLILLRRRGLRFLARIMSIGKQASICKSRPIQEAQHRSRRIM